MVANRKLVPLEPTPEQHEAGHAALKWYDKMTEKKQVQRRSVCDTIYMAMVKAAPPAIPVNKEVNE